MSQSLSRRMFIKHTFYAGAFLGSTAGQAEPNIDFKIGQMVMTNFAGLTAHAEIQRLIRDFSLGGVLLFENNFSTAAAPKMSLQKLTADLQRISSTPLLIAIDQEGGAVNRLKEKYGFPPFHSAQYFGDRNDTKLTQSAARTMAASLESVGINHNFAPVVDVNVNPANPVVGANKRCYSSDPNIVAEQAAAFIRAHREKYIITTLKHFPGHGSSTSDSHKGVTDVSNTWTTAELVPYKKLIEQNLVDSIMTAHIYNANLDETYPASLSHKTITTLLRGKLGFHGVVISDDLLMGAIKNEFSLEESIQLAINAGNDILLFTTIADNLIPRVINIVKTHIKNGVITKERIDASYKRIKQLKQNIV